MEGGSIARLPRAPTPTPTATPAGTLTEDQFATQTFDDVQAMWSAEFSRAGLTYHPAQLILYSTTVETACGSGSAEVGPFYCPADSTVYIDLQFLTLMQQQLGAPGDFARAYIIAHEVGHHIQNLLGISARAQSLQQQLPQGQANGISVRVELQADCLAGVWAHSAYQRGAIGQAEFQQALRAAASVGDDLQQQMSGNEIEPENWTHGTSAQRQEWLRRGFDSGNANSCDTFAA